ncbi:MAG: hypothetical protein N3A61_01050 [Ignavibacteria bacterium]|nr:hypothetical protein [Ignavibacteria bacterium]
MNVKFFTNILGYFTVTVIVLVGIGIIFNFFTVFQSLGKFQIIFGIVFILYGIFRLVTLLSQRKKFDDNDV